MAVGDFDGQETFFPKDTFGLLLDEAGVVVDHALSGKEVGRRYDEAVVVKRHHIQGFDPHPVAVGGDLFFQRRLDVSPNGLNGHSSQKIAKSVANGNAVS